MVENEDSAVLEREPSTSHYSENQEILFDGEFSIIKVKGARMGRQNSRIGERVHRNEENQSEQVQQPQPVHVLWR
ncbi:MAG: hypothetical protein GY816_22660 [Cytophagales bacterium]|nr:hypothetical protein [Cytophagales bacterium]